jgi:signal transduction histidine kinase
MKNSLYQRLALTLLVLFIAIAGLFFWWSQNLEQLSRNEAEQRLHISLAEHLANDNPLLKEGNYDYDALKNLFHSLMILGPSFEFYFIDPTGKILSYSADPGKVKRKTINTQPLLDLIEQKKSLPIYGDDPRDIDGKKIFSTTAIYNGDTLKGYLYVIIGGEIYDSIFSGIQSNQHLSQSIALVFGSVIFFFLVLLALLRYLTLPLKELTKDIRQFKGSEFNGEKIHFRDWPNAENNEIHELGRTFNDMAQRINDQFIQLQDNDRNRRELLTHLSHDLRTPLASLQGYLETIELKRKQLTDEQHQHFFAVAVKNANHLKRLIDQVFELAHLEGGQVKVHLEPFPLGELLHDIVAKFSIKAQQKQITLEVDSNDLEFEVVSDIEKLERVLSNLIDNAIRHTDKGGHIILKSQVETPNHIKLEVIDNGTGIEAKDLAHIFEARYRASNSIEDNRQHNGLGLAISEKLARLLNSQLAVSSAIGEGSTFSIELGQ